MSRITLLALLFSILAPTVAIAQPNTPSAHFGASTVPSRDIGTYVGISLDRFTPTGRVDRPQVYNDIDRTLGFNFLSLGAIRRSERVPNLFYQGAVQLGWGHDQPTAWIQDRLHRIGDLPQVRSTNPRNNVLDAAVSVEAFLWTPAGRWGEQFTGVGTSIGTPHSESWFQTGFVTRPDDIRWPTLSASVRVGVPFLGGAFPDSTISDVYAALELKTDLPLARWFGVEWLPDFFITARQDTGFFVDTTGQPMPERNGGWGFAAPSGLWKLEVWNEYLGGRHHDIGPTGGGRIVVRLPQPGDR